MNIDQVFSGVRVAGMSWTLHAAGPIAGTAHPAIAAHGAAPQRKRRAAAAIVASVHRGPC